MAGRLTCADTDGVLPPHTRYDLNTDGMVTILDILLYKAWLGMSCTNP